VPKWNGIRKKEQAWKAKKLRGRFEGESLGKFMVANKLAMTFPKRD